MRSLDDQIRADFEGGENCRKLSVALYSRIKLDPLLRSLFPGKTLHCATEEFAAFLVQFFGGSSEHTQRRWWLSLRESHARFKIGPKERAAWLKRMSRALDDVVEEPLRSALHGFFQQSSSYVIGKEPDGDIEPEIARRWQFQLALDEAVTSIRAGHYKRAMTIIDQAVFSASVQVGLFSLMMKTGDPGSLEYVRAKISADPLLLQERFAGRSLLHDAAAQGNLPMVELLIRMGSDPNGRTAGGRTPLYCLANEYKGAGGAVVRALVRAGADVNAACGTKRCTPLHMAARRGNVKIAEALLDCGAEIKARDSTGDTPLQRAVNCRKSEVAKLLRERGA